MHLREATNADAPAIKELVFSILASYGLNPDPACTDKDLEDIETNYFRNNGYFAVLEAGGAIIGSYGIWRMKAEECELRKMYLDARHRGKGLGKMLLEHALRKAEELSYKVVCLETASVLVEAIALYEKYGFSPYQPEHMSTRCNQAYRKVIKANS